MAAPKFRETYNTGRGGSMALKTGTANTTAAEVIAAPGSGKAIRVARVTLSAAGDPASTSDNVHNLITLADGTTNKMGWVYPGTDISVSGLAIPLNVDTGPLPAGGWRLTANTALNIDFAATDANLDYAVTVFYDVVPSTGQF